MFYRIRGLDENAVYQKFKKDFHRIDSFQSCREFSSAELDKMIMENKEEAEEELKRKLDRPKKK